MYLMCINATVGYVGYVVKTGGPSPSSTTVQVVDTNNTVIATQYSMQGQFVINNAYFWWPYTMSKDQYGYMYQLVVSHMKSNPMTFKTAPVTGLRLLVLMVAQVVAQLGEKSILSKKNRAQ